MMKKVLFILAFVFLSIISINLIHASIDDVQYPVAELGNCNSQTECETYCDDVSNMGPCLDFAEKYQIMSQAEIDEARKFMPLMQSGQTPGGCKNQRECQAYCDNDANIMECVEFAKKAGIISDEEYEMVKKTGGKGPGGCKRDECDTFCEKEENFNVCIEFARENGLISPEDYEMAKKTGGKGPGGCKGKEECDAFCNDDANFLTCLEFGREHGMVSDEEYERAKKSGSNHGPGGCKSESECDAYCKANMEECKKWGEEHGLEFEQKEGQGPNGPGGCQSEEECKAFCNNPDNTQTCMEWSVREGKMNQEDYNKFLQDRENGGGECASQCEQRTGEMLTGTNMINGQCECYYAPIENEPGDYQEQQPGSWSGGEGGCNQPGPEGQCNPGPGAGETPGGGSGGETPGDATGGSPGGVGTGDAGGSSGGGESSGGDSGSGGGDSGSITGGVVYEVSGDNWLMKIIRWIFGI